MTNDTTQTRIFLHFFLKSFLIELSFLFLCMTIQTAFTTKKGYGKGEREAQWASAQRSLHGLQPPQTSGALNDKSNHGELTDIAQQAKRRAEVARYAQNPGDGLRISNSY